MQMFNTVRAVRAGLVFLAVAALACSKDPVRVDDHDHGEEVDAIRVTVTRAGGVQEVHDGLEPSAVPHEIELDIGANQIVVQWLDHDGHVISDLGSEFALEIDGLPAEMTFTSTGQFAGTITVTGVPTGPSTSVVELYHIDEGHGDFTVAVSFIVVVA